MSIPNPKPSTPNMSQRIHSNPPTPQHLVRKKQRIYSPAHDMNLEEDENDIKEIDPREVEYKKIQTEIVAYVTEFPMNIFIDSSVPITDKQEKFLNSLQNYLQDIQAHVDDVMLMISLQYKSIRPQLINLMNANLINDKSNHWWWKVELTESEKKKLEGVSNLRTIKMAKALSMINNVDIELALPAVNWYIKVNIGRLWAKICNNRNITCNINEKMVGPASCGKWHCMYFLIASHFNVDIKTRDFLDRHKYWSEYESDVSGDRTSFGQFIQSTVMSLSSKNLTFDELGNLLKLMEIRMDSKCDLQSEGYSAFLNSMNCSRLGRKFMNKEFNGSVEDPYITFTTCTQEPNAKKLFDITKHTGYPGRWLVYRGQPMNFVQDGVAYGNISTLDVYRFQLFVQNFGWSLQLNNKIPSLIQGFADATQITYDIKCESVSNILNKIVHIYKSVEYDANPSGYVHSIIQKYCDLASRLAAQWGVSEYWLHNHETFGRFVLPDKTSITAFRETIKNTYTITDPAIIISAFCTVFGLNLRNLSQIMTFKIRPFEIKPIDIKIEFSSRVLQMEKNVCDNKEDIDAIQLKIDNVLENQNVLNVKEPEIRLVEDLENELNQIILMPGSYINIVEVASRGTFKKLMKLSKTPTQMCVWLANWFSGFGFGKLIKSGIAGATWIFEKSKLPDNVDNLTDEQVVGLASMKISLKRYNDAYSVVVAPANVWMKNAWSHKNKNETQISEIRAEYCKEIAKAIENAKDKAHVMDNKLDFYDEMKDKMHDLVTVQYGKQWLTRLHNLSHVNAQMDSNSNAHNIITHFLKYTNDNEYLSNIDARINKIQSNAYNTLLLKCRISSKELNAVVANDAGHSINYTYSTKSKKQNFKLLPSVGGVPSPPQPIAQLLKSLEARNNGRNKSQSI